MRERIGSNTSGRKETTFYLWWWARCKWSATLVLLTDIWHEIVQHQQHWPTKSLKPPLCTSIHHPPVTCSKPLRLKSPSSTRGSPSQRCTFSVKKLMISELFEDFTDSGSGEKVTKLLNSLRWQDPMNWLIDCRYLRIRRWRMTWHPCFGGTSYFCPTNSKHCRRLVSSLTTTWQSVKLPHAWQILEGEKGWKGLEWWNGHVSAMAASKTLNTSANQNGLTW